MPLSDVTTLLLPSLKLCGKSDAARLCLAVTFHTFQQIKHMLGKIKLSNSVNK